MILADGAKSWPVMLLVQAEMHLLHPLGLLDGTKVMVCPKLHLRPSPDSMLMAGSQVHVRASDDSH